MKTRISVTATTRRTSELQHFPTYENFIQNYRFFISSGLVCSDEEHFNKIVEFLKSMDKDCLTVTTIRSGLNITFRYEKEI